VPRRGVRVSDPSRWVFNRLARDYLRRPGYPPALAARLLELAGGPGARVADLGAGTGHLALPLARLGAEVDAVEPARAMLDVLAEAKGALPVRPVHAAAEETGLPAGAFDLALLADALQWVDPERGGREVGRLLAPRGALAVVVPILADTPFLRALRERIARANPKARPRPPPVARLAAAAGLGPPHVERLADEILLDDDALGAVVRSLSYAGPALGPAALEALLADARALARAHGGAVWRRDILLHVASRGAASAGGAGRGSGKTQRPERCRAGRRGAGRGGRPPPLAHPRGHGRARLSKAIRFAAIAAFGSVRHRRARRRDSPEGPRRAGP
jgi:SAM-dependent methyltransferase